MLKLVFENGVNRSR